MLKIRYLLTLALVSALSAPLLASNASKYKFGDLYEEEGHVYVPVKNTTAEEKEKRKWKQEPVSTTFIKWAPHDDELYAQKILKCVVMLKGKKHDLDDYTAEEQHPYTHLNTTEEPEGSSINQWATVYQFDTYERPDKTTLKIKGKALYQIKIDEMIERITTPLRVCVKEEDKITPRGFNTRKTTRHTIEEYEQFKRLRRTYQRAIPENDEDEPEETLVKEEGPEVVAGKCTHSGEDGRCGDVKKQNVKFL
jgi:hypothetical protein